MPDQWETRDGPNRPHMTSDLESRTAMDAGLSKGWNHMTRKMTTTVLGGLTFALVIAMASPAPARGATPQMPDADARELVSLAARDAAVAADTVEVVYRRARTLLNEGRYQEAADLFAELRARYDTSQYVPETYYFEALARYRTEQRADMERALRLLQSQLEGFPDATTARESEVLLARIRAELAQRGSASAERAVAQELAQLEQQLAQTAAATEQVARRMQAAERRALGARMAALESARAQQACEAEWEVRAVALQALYRMDPERGNDILRDILRNRDECARTVREMALWILAERAEGSDTEARDLLIELALEDVEQDSDVREVALMVLAQSDDDAAFDALTRMVAQQDAGDLGDELYYALAMSGRPEAVDILEQRLLAGNVENEEALVYALAEVGGTDVLRRVYSRLSPDSRAAVVWAVASRDDDEARAWLRDRLADPNESPEVRAAALYRLADDGTLSTSFLLDLYRTTEEAELREQSLWLVAQMDDAGDPGPRIDALIEIVRSEEDPDLRQTALHALTEIDDPRVATFIEAFLRGGGGA